MLGEDVEDQPGAVDDLHLDDVLELAQLTGRELAVDDDGVGAVLDHDVAQLARLARADVRRRIRPVAALDEAVDDDRPGGLGQARELGEAALGVVDRSLGPHADQHDALEADLAVLDLGDVGELGREPLHASQRRTVGQVERPRRRLVVALGVEVVIGLERLEGALVELTLERVGREVGRAQPPRPPDRRSTSPPRPRGARTISVTRGGGCSVAASGGGGGVVTRVELVQRRSHMTSRVTRRPQPRRTQIRCCSPREKEMKVAFVA